MKYTDNYKSPIGDILLAADETGLTGLWFDKQKYYSNGLKPDAEEKKLSVFAHAKRWLDIYFSGREPNFTPQISMAGTSFQLEVWNILCRIPYGKTMTYGEIAAVIARKRGTSSMSARAVGAAIGKNRISIIIPCHRVVGADGRLTGYAGGTDKKAKLLDLEKIESRFEY